MMVFKGMDARLSPRSPDSCSRQIFSGHSVTQWAQSKHILKVQAKQGHLNKRLF